MNDYATIENYIAANYIRYDKLRELINIAYNGSNANEVNIFIDMYSCIKRLYSSNDNLLAASSFMSLTSSMINMCAHYRHFLRRYLGVESRIFIVMSHNSNAIQTRMVEGWNYSYIKNRSYANIEDESEPNMDVLVDASINFLNTLCPYLPNIYFIMSNHESTVIIDNLIKQYGNNNPNIIITKDIVPMQLISRYNETSILRPKKYNGEDLSYIIGPFRNKESIMRFWQYYELNYHKSAYDGILIHPCNINILLSMVGCKDRNIKAFITYKKAKKYIFNVVGEMAIECSIESLFKSNDIKEFSIHNILPRYNALNVDFLNQYFITTPEYSLIRGVINNTRSNPVELKRINDSYFTDTPIDLDRL